MRGLTFVVLGVILAVCLVPSGDVQSGVRVCLVCGEEGAADAVLNALLYLPLGFLLGLSWRSIARVVAAALVLSVAVESAQLWLPGRFTSTADVLANTLGASLGAVAALHRDRWLYPPRGASRVLSWCYAAAATAALAISASLYRPVIPDVDVFVGWTPDLGAFERYSGSVVSASIGGHAVPNATRVSAAARTALERGESLEIGFVLGSPPGGLAPLFHLPVRSGPDVLALIVRDSDVIVRRRSRSAYARLTLPRIEFLNALEEMSPGDTVSLALGMDGGGRYLLRAGPTYRSRGFNTARSWSLWHDPLGASDLTRAGLDLLWIALLIAPIGYWATSWTQTIAAGTFPLAALALVPFMSVLVSPPFGYFPWGVAILVWGRVARVWTTARVSI